jgi:hypothetical protein
MNKIKILSVNDAFDLTQCAIGTPGRLQGGSYYSKLFYNKDALYFRMNDIYTKQGIVETGKKKYIDYMYSVFETEYIEWFKQLEEQCKSMLIEKTNDWFSNIEKDDIEHFFISSIRPYKTNKTLIRSHLYTGDSVNRKCTVFDENKIQTKYENVNGKKINSIVHIKGIRFTSSSFQLDIETKQVLIQEDANIFNQCLMTDERQEQSPITTTEEKEEEAKSKEHSVAIEIDTLEDKMNNEPIETDGNTVNTEDQIEQKEEEVEVKEFDVLTNTNSEEVSNNTEEVVGVSQNCVDEPKYTEEENMDNTQIINTTEKTQEPSTCLEEVDLDYTSLQEDKDTALKLVDPNTIYKEMYRKAKRKLRETRKQAIKAYLEADQMKNQYNISSSEEDDENTETDDDDKEESDMFMEKMINNQQR